MIEYFNIPAGAQINTPISKTMFADKGDLSSAEKKLLRECVESFVMKGLIQTRTSGIDSYIDENYRYDQLVVAEISITNATKAEAVANMVQKNFPAPMVLIISAKNYYYWISWCTKRINQADNSKRVLEDIQLTRRFTIDPNDSIASDWVKSLDFSSMSCENIKELSDSLGERLVQLKVADEVGLFSNTTVISAEEQRLALDQLEVNREQQNSIKQALKKESQFNAKMKLATQLKELQDIEKCIIDKMR